MDLSCSKYITKSLEPKVLPSELHHPDLAILLWGGGGGFFSAQLSDIINLIMDFNGT